MGPCLLVFTLLLLVPVPGGAVEASASLEQETIDNFKHGEEGEAKAEREVITPITLFPDKKPFEQAQDELAQAEELWKKGQAEAASDLALEAYDDFGDAWVPKKLRTKRRRERGLAARIYVDAGIACIQDFVQKSSRTPEAIAEGRSRLGDLRDVANNYTELNKKLRKAIEQYTVAVSTGPVR